MEIQKLILDEWEDENLQLGLIQLTEKLPDHEFFFTLNRLNAFQFTRIEDLYIEGQYYHYWHPAFEAYDQENKTKIRLIANQSCASFQQKEITELFIEEHDVNLLLKKHAQTTYILKTSDNIVDFSLFLLPENLVQNAQVISLSSDDELYHIIQYYE